MATLKKSDLLLAMSAHVRGTGLAGASLRPLARAAGTSDRMLIYHFGSKGALIGELLDHLAGEILSALSAALPPQPAASEAACLEAIVKLLRTATFRPYLKVWLDILSEAGREEASHIRAARRILTGQLDWIAARLPVGTDAPKVRAKEMLALVQGVLVLEVAGMQKAADLAIARFYPRG
ncbi:TetR family transcriptional regulator [Rhodobacterales bacterium HKCCSP123]|nr:TetR family transcriptional regulator [Rhodobacterales bacterium HKCCSP123]